MNNKIFNLLVKKLQDSFNLPKYSNIFSQINENTIISDLPWTPARYHKFKESIETELQLNCEFNGTVREVTELLDKQYLSRFFGEIWQPRTDQYAYTGWNLAEKINKENPSAVLDVGCGYNPFKGRIQNLVGIDPYNNCSDFQVDILDYKVKPKSYDAIIALGSINFGDQSDIEVRLQHCVNLLKQNGKMYIRANPGITHKNGPYVDIFPWTFELVNLFAEKFNLNLLDYKKDANDRIYFVYQKK